MSLSETHAVPLNTMLADLDESLRLLLQDELSKHGFELVQVVFDAPTKEWASTLSAPTLNLFLYDIRETKDHRPVDWEEHRDDEGRRFDRRPPLRVDVAYAVTAWTRSVEDEHRMLSQALAILFSFPVLPRGELTGSLRNGTQRFPLNTRIAQERSDGGSNFWTAVGGQYKASLDYVVTLACEPGTMIERGPEVRTQTIQTQLGTERDTREEANRFGGTVRDETGRPVAGVWVGLPESGRFAVTDARGTFILEHVPLGAQKLVARGLDGAEQEAKIEVPGNRVDIVLGGAEKPKKARASDDA
jgi:Pvc16 N-terminal domain/Carboxypeptidase regulatory-like domain